MAIREFFFLPLCGWADGIGDRVSCICDRSTVIHITYVRNKSGICQN